MSAPSTVGLVAAEVEPITETIWADADDLVAQWEDEGGATTNLWQSVNADSDATYVTLVGPSVIVESGSRSLRFGLENPSAAPSSDQTVELRIRCEWIDVFGAANPDAGDPNITIRLIEGATTRAATSAQQISEAPAEYSLFLSESQINSVTDWDDLYAEMTFEASGIDVDEEVNIRVYRARIVFSP